MPSGRAASPALGTAGRFVTAEAACMKPPYRPPRPSYATAERQCTRLGPIMANPRTNVKASNSTPVVAGASKDPNAAKMAAFAAAKARTDAAPKRPKVKENYMRITHPHDAERLMNLGLLSEQEIKLFKTPVEQGGKGLLPPDPSVEEALAEGSDDVASDDAPEADEDVDPEDEAE